MNKILLEKQKIEAIERMRQLQAKYELNPDLVKYLEESKVYYSYITGSGMIGSIDTITYDKSYVEKIDNFEKRTGSYVYHAIESNINMGNRPYKFLSLLFVSKYENDWTMERLESNYISAYVINLDNDKLSEIGDIFLDGFKGIASDYNVLVRVL